MADGEQVNEVQEKLDELAGARRREMAQGAGGAALQKWHHPMLLSACRRTRAVDDGELTLDLGKKKKKKKKEAAGDAAVRRGGAAAAGARASAAAAAGGRPPWAPLQQQPASPSFSSSCCC